VPVESKVLATSRRLTIIWDTPWNATVWEKAEAKGWRLHAGGPDTETERLSVEVREAIARSVELGPVVLATERPTILQFIVIPMESVGSIYWSASVRPRPKSDPPDDIKKHQTELGGEAGLKAFVVECHSGIEPRIAKYELHAHFSKSTVKCNLVPSIDTDILNSPLSGLGTDFIRKHVKYQIQGGTSGLASLEVEETSKAYIVDIEAKSALVLGDGEWFPSIRDIETLVYNRLFQAEN